MNSTDQPVTIAVVGTHSTGKSTFLARLAHELRRTGLQVATVADLGEQAQRMGMPILWNHTWTSTLWIVTRGISNELEAWLHGDVVLVDRAVPDALGYYRAALAYRGEAADPEGWTYLETLARAHSHRYHLIFRTQLDPDIPLGTNKSRDGNHQFRNLADRHVGEVLAELTLPWLPLAADGHDAALTLAVGFAAKVMKTQAAQSDPQHDVSSRDPGVGGAFGTGRSGGGVMDCESTTGAGPTRQTLREVLDRLAELALPTSSADSDGKR
ncbi:AAA family ATPase [Nocardia wallacei]|uniref:AAA family ATPase n=1 Tax=Nocardia wallacei TaxID=480035 RepID=UPI0024584959|nr:AAA family ATPase [Nocardia wallacei]